ncbi:MAG: hypothetical protein V7738_16640 [Dietzia maris]
MSITIAIVLLLAACAVGGIGILRSIRGGLTTPALQASTPFFCVSAALSIAAVLVLITTN